MAPRKKPTGRPKGRTEVRAFQVRLPLPLDNALEEARQKSRRPKNTEIQLALEQYLASLGLWPPNGQADKEE